jgi:hypothetical protein
MQVLLEAPSEEFFSSAKQTRNKNWSIKELSPYAREFFRVFLEQKRPFKKPVGRAFFRPYISVSIRLGPWPQNSWETVSHNLVLGIIDFRRVPNFTSLCKTSAQKPYFKEIWGHCRGSPCHQ